MLKKFENQNKGITLIALVITIIVLLILAGISISMLSGDNSIISRAGEAKDKTELESLKEEVKIVMSNRTIEKTIAGTNSKTLKQDLESGINNGEVEEINKADGTTKYTDVCYVSKNGKSVTVYEDGEVEEGKVSIWKGVTDIECPEFKKDENNVWNWYIYTAGQLKFLADFVNNGNSLNGTENGADLNNYVTQAHYDPSTVTMSTDTTIYLMNNIDLGARPGVGATEEEKWETNPDELKWTPIGIDYNNVQDKLGTFEGNNFSICGVYVNRDANFNGIFGSSNTINDLTIKDSFLKGNNATGGIVGSMRNGIINNCHNKNTIIVLKEDSILVGGIIGQSIGKTKNCTNTGNIIGNVLSNNVKDSYVGGIAGEALNITNCTNLGEITKVGNYVGGIVGHTTRTIDGCKNKGKIEANGNSIGGITGFTNEASTISNCDNSGFIITKGRGIGGIAGYLQGSMNNCKNNGDIEGNGDYVGGIVGRINTSTVSNSINIGSVIGKSYYIGGIVGQARASTISKCVNEGIITGGIKALGGIVGIIGWNNDNCMLKNNYNIGKVVANNKFEGLMGGIAGYGIKTEIKYNYNIGILESSRTELTNVGGVIGSLSSGTNSNNYYLKGKSNIELNNLSESKNSEEMKEQNFLNKLNENQIPAVWEFRNEENNGYPVFIKNE